ncbi:hypothetical protein R6Q59_020380 [Mikania micrantha]|uniref:Uncharacterized protein n=1 Tax=Mikania micrantha TaxID=192012 RepID=A0A5N6L725_9ASTR|nr:hypothetical protein E3N88_46250 [Mikania micrantha]
MEWNCCWSLNHVTPFLFESIGDSEDVKSDVHHDHQEDEAVIDESEAASFRFDDKDEDEDEDDDDDAQSCSYDHSSYIKNKYDDSQHDQSQRLIYDDHGNTDDDDDGDDDDEIKNWGVKKMMDSCKRQKISHNFCADSSDQGEIDRRFWEACLAT